MTILGYLSAGVITSAIGMDNLKKNTAEQITAGFMDSDSLEDFEKRLERFPDDPALQRAAADVMGTKNMPAEAALSYIKAASLYLKSGNLLPALASVVHSWRLKAPSHQQAAFFLPAMRDDSFPNTPLKAFFKNLSNPEILAVVKNFESIHLPAQQLLQKKDDTQDNLYFIVSGSLKETGYHPVIVEEETVYIQSIVNLSANDSIGDLYPLKEDKICQTAIKTTTPVELLKISKRALLQICQQYPKIESGLQAINAYRSELPKENGLEKKRKKIRNQVTNRLTLEMHPQSSNKFPTKLEGYFTDISIGGTCVVLDFNEAYNAKSAASFAKTIKNSAVKISFPAEGIELKVSGKIAWTKEIFLQKETTLTLGVLFQNLSPKLRGMLFVFVESIKKKLPLH
jgi:CRP-like cAMP-binding protein